MISKIQNAQSIQKFNLWLRHQWIDDSILSNICPTSDLLPVKGNRRPHDSYLKEHRLTLGDTIYYSSKVAGFIFHLLLSFRKS